MGLSVVEFRATGGSGGASEHISMTSTSVTGNQIAIGSRRSANQTRLPMTSNTGAEGEACGKHCIISILFIELQKFTSLGDRVQMSFG